MKQETFNGWTNYETWNFNIWYGDTLQSIVNEYFEEVDETSPDYVYDIVDNFIDDLIEESINQTGFFGDVMTHAIQQVNKNEIVRHLIEE